MSKAALTKIVLPAALSALLAAACAPAALSATGTPPVPAPGPPKATTGTAQHARGTSATLTGTVDPGGTPTSYYFQYGPTILYTKQTPAALLPGGTRRVKVGLAVSGLVQGYHYRLVASNVHGTAMGADRIFVPKVSTKLKFDLPKTSPPTPYGGGFTISGSLVGSGGANRQVALESSPFPYLSAFVQLDLPVTSDGSGRFLFSVPRLTLSTQFRVSTPGTLPAFSSVITHLVTPRVTLKVRTTKTKGLVRLYGTVTPAKVGAQLALQLQKAVRPGNSKKTSERTSKFATQFKTVVKRGSKTVSRFSMIATITKGGIYRAYVELPKGPIASGASSPVLLHAAPPKAKKH